MVFCLLLQKYMPEYDVGKKSMTAIAYAGQCRLMPGKLP